jgi:hypothetical protein
MVHGECLKGGGTELTTLVIFYVARCSQGVSSRALGSWAVFIKPGFVSVCCTLALFLGEFSGPGSGPFDDSEAHWVAQSTRKPEKNFRYARKVKCSGASVRHATDRDIAEYRPGPALRVSNRGKNTFFRSRFSSQ